MVIALLAAPVTAQEFFTLNGHGGPIMDIAVSPSGQVATASFDNSVGVWDGVQPRWLEGHRAAVNTVTFWDNTTLVSGGDDFDLWHWSESSAEGRKLASHTAKITDIAIAPDSVTIASSSWDATIGVHTGGATQSLKGHRSGVNALAFNADGKVIYSASVDGTIRSWRYTEVPMVSNVMVKHGFGINELIVTDEWLAYGATDGGTRMIDLETGAQIAD
ncbi:MAG: WD40 repeat domain-containing protein, partial [Roseobacter sp.]